jgi:hypothetical protein
VKPKIYVFVANRWGDDYSMIAVAEDGDEVAGHVSSSPDFGKWDMGLGTSTRKHDQYKAKYPDGYELEWVEDWKTHPVLGSQAEKSKASKQEES